VQLSAAVLFCASAAALEVNLVAADEAGLERKSGTITSGVPFARGAVKDVKKLSVSIAGKAVPAQFAVLAPWDDGSVRWALLDCQADVPPSGKTKLVVRDDGKNPAPAAAAAAEVDDARVTMSSGPLVLVTERGEGPIFQSLKVDGRELVTGGTRGLVLLKAGGGEVTAGPPDEVKVESAGPMRATVMLRGKFPEVHNGLLGYTVRVSTFAGRKFVKVRAWLENRGAHGYSGAKNRPPSKPEWFAFDGLSLDLGLALGGEITAECEGASAAGKLKVLQLCGTTGPKGGRGGRLFTYANFEYRITGGGKELAKGARTDGVVRLTGEAGKLTAAVRHFWQNYEKAVELDGSKLRVWLWPTEGQYPRASGGRLPSYAKNLGPLRKQGLYNLPGSVHKGHEMILDFSGRDAKDSSAELSRPLFAMASAEHYAATEAAPGLFAPPGAKTGDDDCDAKLAAWSRMMRSSADPKQPGSIVTGRRGSGIWYGWMDFGDLSLPGKGAVSLHYDWPWIICCAAMRTGDPRLLRLADEMTRHRVEVDQQWSDSPAVGAQFVGYQRAGQSFPHFHCSRFSRSQPTAGSSWVAGVVLYHMLTGDPKAGECARRCGKALAEFPDRSSKSKDWGTRMQVYNMRACADAIFGCCAMYALTAEKAWLESGLKIFRGPVLRKWKSYGAHLHDVRQIRSQSYTKDDIKYCYGIQGFCLLHHLTGDEHLFEMLRVGCDREFSRNFFGASLFLADLHAYVALKTGDEDYGDDALEHWLEASPESDCPPVYLPDNTKWSERSAMHLRAGHVLQHYFWRKGRGEVPAAKKVEVKPMTPAEFPEDGGKLVIEAEDMRMERAWVKKLDGASGGKGVLFDYLDGFACGRVKLKKGTYEVVAHILAPDREADAFFIKLGGKYERVYADEQKQLSTASRMKVEITEDGVSELRIEPAETDFYVDRLEITLVK
jgi:hypothetical protein